jgi:hypothetical protein
VQKEVQFPVAWQESSRIFRSLANSRKPVGRSSLQIFTSKNLPHNSIFFLSPLRFSSQFPHESRLFFWLSEAFSSPAVSLKSIVRRINKILQMDYTTPVTSYSKLITRPSHRVRLDCWKPGTDTVTRIYVRHMTLALQHALYPSLMFRGTCVQCLGLHKKI